MNKVRVRVLAVKPRSFTLALRIPSWAADVSRPWAILVDDAGRPRLDAQGRPQAADPSGKVLIAMEPISSGWLIPDVKNPIRRRVLFRTRRVE